MNEDKISKEIRQLGILHESIQDDIQKLLEIVKAQQPAIAKIPKMSERIEEIEVDISTLKLATRETNRDLTTLTHGVKHMKQNMKIMEQDIKLIKIRTEKLDEIIDELKYHEVRLKQLETA